MSDRTFERAVLDWLEDGSDRTPRPAIEAVLLAVKTTPQEGELRLPWRTNLMPSSLRAVAAIAVIAVIAVGTLAYISRMPGIGGPSPALSPSAIPSPAASAGASGSPAPIAIDTSQWVRYTSARYGFELAYPAQWTAVPADHDWTWDGDAANWLSTGQDRFISPNDALRIGVWTVPIDGSVDETWAAVEAWAADYCARSANAPCTGIHERVVPMCIEKRDCHPALIVPFKEDVQFFGHGGVLPEGMTVVAVWRPDTSSTTSSYGGSVRLLQALLSTMDVWAPFYPESQDAAATFLLTGR